MKLLYSRSSPEGVSELRLSFSPTMRAAPGPAQLGALGSCLLISLNAGKRVCTPWSSARSAFVRKAKAPSSCNARDSFARVQSAPRPELRSITLLQRLLRLATTGQVEVNQKRYGCDFNWQADRALKANDPAKTILQPKNNLECGVKILVNQTIVQHKPLLTRSGY